MEDDPRVLNVLSEKGTVAGVDVAYKDNLAVCCIDVFDVSTKQLIEQVTYSSETDLPYMAGYLSFRELPFVYGAFKLLKITPDLLMVDGNGILHPRNMGEATHMSIIFGIPSIGVAKTYHKIDDVVYQTPGKNMGDYTNIVIKDSILGYAVTTKPNCKPVFVSCGNLICLESAKKISLNLCDGVSRIPYPIRSADIRTRVERLNIFS